MTLDTLPILPHGATVRLTFLSTGQLTGTFQHLYTSDKGDPLVCLSRGGQAQSFSLPTITNIEVIA